MTIANDALGQELEEMTPEQARTLFEKRCREELGVPPEAFLEAHDSGRYPEAWDIAAISRVEFLVPFAR